MRGCGFGWAKCLCSVFIFNVSPNSTISCVDPGRDSCCVALGSFQTPFTVLKHTQDLTMNIPFTRFVPVLSSNVYTFSIIFADLLHPIPSFSCIGRLESTLLPGRWDVGGVIQELAPYMGGNSWHLRNHLDLLEPKWPCQWKLMSLAKLLCLLGPQHGQPSMPDKQIPMWVLPSGWNAGWGVSHFSRFQSCLFFYEVLFIGGSHHSRQSPVEVVKHYAHNNDGPWVIDFLALTWQGALAKPEIAQMALKKDGVKFIQSQSPAVIQ